MSMQSGETSPLRECLSRLALQRNPFQEKISYEDLWFGPREHLDSVKWYLDSIEDYEKANLLLLGEYGTGKTYTLLRLFHIASTEKPSVVPVYLKMERPERGFRTFYQFFMEAVGRDRLVSMINEIKKRSNCSTKKDFLSHLRGILVTEAVCKAFARIAFDGDDDLVLSWIMGTAGYWDAYRLGLDIYASNYKHALSMLLDVIRIASHLGKTAMILIDEVENLVGFSRRVEEVREGLRDLYDEIVYSEIGDVLIVTACTAEAYSRLSVYLGEAFRDRIDEEIMVRQFDDETARSYLKDVLAWAKDADPTELRDFSPFHNEDSVEKFLELSRLYMSPTRPARGLTRRKILKVGALVLKATCQSKGDAITPQIIEKVKRERVTGF